VGIEGAGMGIGLFPYCFVGVHETGAVL